MEIDFEYALLRWLSSQCLSKEKLDAQRYDFRISLHLSLISVFLHRSIFKNCAEQWRRSNERDIDQEMQYCQEILRANLEHAHATIQL